MFTLLKEGIGFLFYEPGERDGERTNSLIFYFPPLTFSRFHISDDRKFSIGFNFETAKAKILKDKALIKSRPSNSNNPTTNTAIRKTIVGCRRFPNSFR